MCSSLLSCTAHSSLHPVPLVPVLLTHSLPSQPTATLSKTIEFLSKTHCDAVRSGAVRIIHEEVLGWREGGLGVKLLLRLAVLSQPFLEAVSAACLEIGIPATAIVCTLTGNLI